MKPSAAMSQEANFSPIGRFGNCPLVVPLARGGRDSGRGGGAQGGCCPRAGAIFGLWLGGGLHDLLLDEAKMSRQ